MSRTDKTRPHWVKVKELEPHTNIYWRPEFRCGHNCYCGYGWYEQQKSKARRQRKAAARNWHKEYE